MRREQAFALLEVLVERDAIVTPARVRALIEAIHRQEVWIIRQLTPDERVRYFERCLELEEMMQLELDLKEPE